MMNDQLAAFDHEHGAMVANALTVYAQHMRETAREAQAGYDAIKDDPARRAAQDRSMITTRGLTQLRRHSAGRLTGPTPPARHTRT